MIIIGILLFMMLVVVHELGHFLAARRAGVDVEEFGIGFPPRLFGKKLGKHDTLYSINLIPLGGFVRLKGEEAESHERGSFGAARFKNKLKIGFAGVAMNILAAYVLVLLLALHGLPKMIDGQFTIKSDEHNRQQEVLVVDVEPDSAAAQAGLKRGDRIISIDKQAFNNADQLISFTKGHPDKTVSINYLHHGQSVTSTAKLATKDGRGLLGIVPYSNQTVRYGWSAPLVAAVVTLQLIWLTIAGFFHLLVGLLSHGTGAPEVAAVAGPISIFALLKGAGDFGFSYVLLLIISISISLAVINSLPIPALDGGRMALISVFKALKKPLSKQFENAVHSAGFVLLMLLAVVISIADIKRLF